jgi:hypothetical protein
MALSFEIDESFLKRFKKILATSVADGYVTADTSAGPAGVAGP